MTGKPKKAKRQILLILVGVFVCVCLVGTFLILTGRISVKVIEVPLVCDKTEVECLFVDAILPNSIQITIEKPFIGNNGFNVYDLGNGNVQIVDQDVEYDPLPIDEGYFHKIQFGDGGFGYIYRYRDFLYIFFVYPPQDLDQDV